MFAVRCSPGNTAVTIAQVTVVAIILSASDMALEKMCAGSMIRNLKEGTFTGI
jgi:hypothetical protein